MESEIIRKALRETFAGTARFSSEGAFQASFARTLGNAERELRAVFAAPAKPPRRPPPSAIHELASRKTPLALPPEGKDPCARAAKLDVLWTTAGKRVPIELKYRNLWNADTYGYIVLKDLHRLERMTAAGPHADLSPRRYALFVTSEPIYWEGRRPEPQPFWLRDGSKTQPGQWFQYDQLSPDTCWWRYPPFHLARGYEFMWEDLAPAGRYLLLEVLAQDA